MNKINTYRFEGLNVKEISNKYYSIDRVSEDKVIVRVSENQILKTRYGYALILDNSHVVFLKDWLVESNYRIGSNYEVILSKKYFNVKTWGEFEEFEESDEMLTFEAWKKVAEAQETKAIWKK